MDTTLAHTGSPHQYVVEYDALVAEPRDVEQRLHHALSDRRESKDKEWFRCDVGKAIREVRRLVGSEVLIENVRCHPSTDQTKATAEFAQGPLHCFYYGCKQPAKEKLETHGYCKEHYIVMQQHQHAQRTANRQYSIQRLREEIAEVSAKHENKP